MKKAFQALLLALLVVSLLIGPVSLITYIVLESIFFLKIFLIYLVIAVSAYCFNLLMNWADSFNKKA